MNEPQPAFVLNADLEPTGMLIPCPSRMTAVLGFDQPTAIPCGLLAGHDGWHRYEARWADSCEDAR